MNLKKTSLYQKHLENSGRMVDFSGWLLPLEYKSMLIEAKETRSNCGIFDASHMGEILIKGKDRLRFLQRLVTNDISLILSGQMQYNLFLNSKGGIIDDLMVYNLGDSFLCVVNASNKQKVFAWLNENLDCDLEIIDLSNTLALISLQGEDSAKIVASSFGNELKDIQYLHFSKKIINSKEVIISRSGYTGEDGFEVYVPWDEAIYWWDKIAERGKYYNLCLCGLGSRDILRIEAGYPLYGNEINEEINPYEAGLGWAVKLNKDFIGKEVISKVKEEGLQRRRSGFIMQQRAIPRKDYSVYCKDKCIGSVSSGTYSPNIDKFIGMAFLDKGYQKVGLEIDIKIRNKVYKANVAEIPFVKIRTKGVRVVKEV